MMPEDKINIIDERIPLKPKPLKEQIKDRIPVLVEQIIDRLEADVQMKARKIEMLEKRINELEGKVKEEPPF